MLKLAVFVSGRGSNLSAIIQKIKSGKLNAEVLAVISDKNDCKAFEICEVEGIEKFVISSISENSEYIIYDELIKILFAKKIELIVLAGFLKKIPTTFVNTFKNKIINIHPALLPAFGGKGMYGINVHKAVFESSAKASGATIHFVDEIYDNGKIIDQKVVDISDVKSPEEIAERVLKVEHEILPYVIQKFAENKICLIENRVIINRD
ncbi:MAG: phosphoribosylglycinamide formyltransferase [Ignavibacteriae bacterium]|nr:phosphoribosylglycinamide formyltransferase [Ignavibacteriota bacterium]